jgi:hypothetical protein
VSVVEATRLSPAQRLSPVQRVAVRRWKLGHHTFHVLLVAMNTRLHEVADRLEEEEWEAASTAMLDLARLYDAATASMRYTSDFPRIEYERLLRPSMMPPFASPGFSGVFNREHAMMMAGVRRIRTFMKEREDDVPEQALAAWERLREAQQTNVDSHMLVCRKFVDDGVSLLKEFFDQRKEAEE